MTGMDISRSALKSSSPVSLAALSLDVDHRHMVIAPPVDTAS